MNSTRKKILIDLALDYINKLEEPDLHRLITILRNTESYCSVTEPKTEKKRPEQLEKSVNVPLYDTTNSVPSTHPSYSTLTTDLRNLSETRRVIDAITYLGISTARYGIITIPIVQRGWAAFVLDVLFGMDGKFDASIRIDWPSETFTLTTRRVGRTTDKVVVFGFGTDICNGLRESVPELNTKTKQSK